MEPTEMMIDWDRARESALYNAKYNLAMARERGNMCAAFAGLVDAAMRKKFGNDGTSLPALTAEEIGISPGELEKITAIGAAAQQRTLSALTDERNRPKTG